MFFCHYKSRQIFHSSHSVPCRQCDSHTIYLSHSFAIASCTLAAHAPSSFFSHMGSVTVSAWKLRQKRGKKSPFISITVINIWKKDFHFLPLILSSYVSAGSITWEPAGSLKLLCLWALKKFISILQNFIFNSLGRLIGRKYQLKINFKRTCHFSFWIVSTEDN